jgi:hypothetical protein
MTIEDDKQLARNLAEASSNCMTLKDHENGE